MVIGFACTVVAKDYCPKMSEAKKEGDPWHITESAFTKEAANKALKESLVLRSTRASVAGTSSSRTIST
jgi:hypothetical protein